MAGEPINQPAEIPAELDRWNWGAFLLNWIWGIGNSVFIALLMFVPLVNIVMMFVLGARGSRWAWRKRTWRDAEHFRSTQRKWAIAGVIVWIAVAGLIAVALVSTQFAMRRSEAYQMTMDTVRADERVKAALGEEIEAGFWIGGRINVEGGGTGQATLNIPIRGSAGSGAATSRAVRIIGQWDLRLVVVRVDGLETPIVLINKDGIDLPGGSAAAEPMEDAKTAFDRGDYATAAKLLRPLAEQGSANAQYRLGLMYRNGQGLPQDDTEAVKWYRLAADQGLAAARHDLGVMYHEGDGVPQDDAEAVKWSKLAAEQGYAPAQYNLGIAHLRGEGVPQDYGEAEKWFRLAADRGDAEAQYSLGLIYDKGYGVASNEAEAVRWYRLAAEQGLAPAQNNLGMAYLGGEGVPQSGSEAAKWFRLAADQGLAASQYELGVIYAMGEGVPQDGSESAKWLRLAADQGQVQAQYYLGAMYEGGLGVPQDNVQALKWLKLVAGAASSELSAELRDKALGRGKALAAKMTPEQIAEAERLAQKWRPK